MLRLNLVFLLLATFAFTGCSKEETQEPKDVRNTRKMQGKPRSKAEVQNLKQLPQKQQ
jgi:hypothetical protein